MCRTKALARQLHNTRMQGNTSASLESSTYRQMNTVQKPTSLRLLLIIPVPRIETQSQRQIPNTPSLPYYMTVANTGKKCTLHRTRPSHQPSCTELAGQIWLLRLLQGLPEGFVLRVLIFVLIACDVDIGLLRLLRLVLLGRRRKTASISRTSSQRLHVADIMAFSTKLFVQSRDRLEKSFVLVDGKRDALRELEARS